MNYLKFMNLATLLIDKASDGVLTGAEIEACLAMVFPEDMSRVMEEVDKRMASGSITVMEVFNIATSLID